MTDPTTTLPATEPTATEPTATERAAGSGAAPPGAPPVTLALTRVTRDFAGRRVLGPVDLRLDAGVLAVVAGLNGAGKTTLLRVAAGLLVPSGGSRVCAGRAVYSRPGGGARHPLRVGQSLAQTAALTGTSPSTVARAAAAADLEGLTERRVSELSSGQHARLSVALVAAAGPSVVCLDEPTAHLDTAGIEGVRAVVRLLLAGGTAVVLVSHSPEQFADLAHAVLWVEDGLLREAGC